MPKADVVEMVLGRLAGRLSAKQVPYKQLVEMATGQRFAAAMTGGGGGFSFSAIAGLPPVNAGFLSREMAKWAVGTAAEGASEAARSGYAAYRTVMETRPVRIGSYVGAALAAPIIAAPIGFFAEAKRAGRQWKESQESTYMSRLLAESQEGPFGTGMRPYGMGANFGGSAGITLAMHYARNGTGIRNPLFNIAGLAAREVRGVM